MAVAFASPPVSGRASPPASQPSQPSLFDPAIDIAVSEIHPGMKGFGLSVFLGTTIEKFDVQVVSILHHFNPKHDVVLINFSGQNLQHTTAIAGMSGSPIYLYDDTGKARLCGAFAYGWPLQKDALAGVQPIEYMLQLPAEATTQPTTAPAEADTARPPRQWALSDCVLLPGMARPPANYPLARWGSLDPNPVTLADGGGGSTSLRPLATPLMVSGVSTQWMSDVAPLFRAAGLTPVQGGGGGVAAQPGRHVPIEPGSVLGVPLLRGDVDLSAIGTCTAVVGNRVFAFGHPFNSEGPTRLPLGGGEIQGVVANYMTSFKLGSVSAIDGTVNTDQSVGIAGTLGPPPPMIPIDLRVRYTDGSQDQQYHFEAAQHPRFTPLLAAAAVNAAVTGVRELPVHHTVDYDFTIEFSPGRQVHVVNTAADSSAAELFFELGTPLIAAGDNPFQRVTARRITGTMLVTGQSRKADILYAIVSKSRYRRGETVAADVVCRPYRGDEFTIPVTLQLPRDLPNGTYHFTLSDWQKFLQDEQLAEPFRFTAQNIDQVFDVVRDVTSLRHDAVYVRLLRQPDGVAVGHVALPKLPSSRREVMIGSGRSDISQFVSSELQTFKTNWVMNGSAEFDLTIDDNTAADIAAARAAHRAAGSAAAQHSPADMLPLPTGPGPGEGP